MEATIIKIDKDTVYISTPVGSFNGIWCSPTPVCHKRYIVELDSNEVLSAHAISITKDVRPAIEEENGYLCISGYVEEIEDDVLFLRIHTDILMLEIECTADCSKFIDQFVRIYLSKINLYDVDLVI